MARTLGTKGENMNLLIKQGSDFGPFFATMTDANSMPIDLTGCLIRGMIRKLPTDVAPVATLVVVLTAPLLGQYKFSIPSVVTAALQAGIDENAATSKYFWDMEFVDAAGTVIPLYYGEASVFREITK